VWHGSYTQSHSACPIHILEGQTYRPSVFQDWGGGHAQLHTVTIPRTHANQGFKTTAHEDRSSTPVLLQTFPLILATLIFLTATPLGL
jgi:hypothetical protein